MSKILLRNINIGVNVSEHTLSDYYEDNSISDVIEADAAIAEAEAEYKCADDLSRSFS